MRIARLELYGFKSFPDRTAFEFGPGVSCVVGPNGSGKSNVVDAIRWCIGEQSAKSLRGSDMIDVIFAGSADRAPVGFAEVRLTFSSDTGEPFPGEYAQLAELMVGRRLHRNGASEYLINGVKCRRRDILDLFLDTGVGSNLYSFIAQGQVEKIVHANPMDRRAILDEAAGIARYAARRAEAQQRLEATGAQLDRAADVADEMERRIRTLQRQVVRAAEFRRLRALIRQEEIFLSLVRYRELAADRRALRETLRKTSNEAAANRRELARRQEDLSQRREEVAVVEAAASKWRDEVAEFDARARELESARVLQQQRAVELERQAEHQRAEVGSATDAIAREEADAAEAETAAASVEARLGDGAAAREAREEAAREAQRLRREARTALDGHERALAEAEASRTRALERLEALAAAERNRERELQEARSSLDTATKELERRRVALDGVRAAAGQAGAASQQARVARDEVDRLAAAAAEVLKAAEGAVEAADQELDQARVALDAGVEAAAREAEKARREAEAALLAAERAATDQVAQARARGQDGLDRVRATQAERRRNLERLRRERQEHGVRLASLDGEIQRLESERRAAAALGEPIPGLEDARNLLDRLGLDSDEARQVAERVGDRLLLSVASSVEEAERAVLSLGDREGRFLLVKGDPRPAWEAVWSRFETPAEALAHHLATGQGAVAPGVRVDPGGVVHVGRGGVADRLERVARIDAQLGECQQQVEDVEASLLENRAGFEKLAGGALSGDVVEAASRELGRLERRELEGASQAAEDLLAEARAAGETSVERARDAVAAAQEQESGARDRARAEGERIVAQVREQVAGLKTEASQARATMERAREEARRAAEAAAGAELAASRASGELKLAEASEREAAAAVESLQARIASIQEASRVAEGDREKLGSDVELAAARRAELESQSEALSAALIQAEEAETEAVAEAGAVRARSDALTEKLAGLKARAKGARARAHEATERKVRAEREVEELLKRSGEARDASGAARREAGEVSEARAASWDKLQRERERMAKLREALKKAEADGDRLQERSRDFATRVAELEAAVGQAKADLEVLRGNIDERYQISLPALMDRVWAGPVVIEAPEEVREDFEVEGKRIEAVEDFRFTKQALENVEQIEAVVASNTEHRKALARLGEVNLGALEEYGELRGRYAELVEQRGDLESSVADIRRAIAKMNRTCRQRFRDAFDRVNEYFQEVYPRLVGGGSARLSLTDEEDLLQTGVEIYVQPPGKRLQNLTLLSGGEKAMTAIALLIAIFKVKPSPFCVLDEVDAPLDEANGSRFNDILREMSAVSQFLVITHNRKTMECADTLYGVTMGRPGVSKLVSVDLAG